MRLRWNVPIPGYCQPVADTLTHLKAMWPAIRRVWFIRSLVLPPIGMLEGEEIGLHVTAPQKILGEYFAVADHFRRPITCYTRHGRAPIASGGPWRTEDADHVARVLPNLIDLTADNHHYTVETFDPDQFDPVKHWHVLFHPEHLRTHRKQLDAALTKVLLVSR